MITDLKSTSVVKKDRLRFTKNKFSADLTYLAILCNALYFVNIYRSDVGTFYYKIIMGASVVYNLLFMLIAFLASEEVKNYKMKYSYILIALGAGQVARIFILPMEAANTTVTLSSEEQIVMDSSQFMWVCIFLIASAAFCVIAGIIGISKTITLTKYQAELEKKGSKS